MRKHRNLDRLLGFTLVEVTLALGVAAFSLSTIFGLLLLGVNSNQETAEQTAAASLARTIIADLKAVPAKSATRSPKFGFIIPEAGTAAATTPTTIYLGQDGSPSAGKKVGDPPVPGESRYRVSVTLTPPPANQRTATTARVLFTWPAMADSDPNSTPSKFAGSYETVTTLDRN